MQVRLFYVHKRDFVVYFKRFGHDFDFHQESQQVHGGLNQEKYLKSCLALGPISF